MTFVRFAREDESVSFGLLAGDEIQPISGSPFGSWSEEGAAVALSAVRLLAPVEPSKGLALAGNFRDHLHGTPGTDPAGAVLEGTERLHRPR